MTMGPELPTRATPLIAVFVRLLVIRWVLDFISSMRIVFWVC